VYDYRNRIYQPELGRFLQPDPKHFAAGDYNLYRYCHNDPVNKNDPFGLELKGADIDFENCKVDFVTLPGADKYGGIQWDVHSVVGAIPVSGGYTASVKKLDVIILKAEIATKVKVKGEANARFRTDKQIDATIEHERDLHIGIGRSFDKDNQNRTFPTVYKTSKEAQDQARRQLDKDWDKAQQHDKRFEDVMKRESFR
jgi:uncharacterized protein RhaS with RHS repeats